MARFKSTTFGQISGKHGTAVAVISGSNNYMRLHTVPANPRTEKQVKQRARFAFSVRALRPFLPVFRETAKGTQGLKNVRSNAFKKAVTGDYPNFELDYEQLMFTLGNLDQLHHASATLVDETVTLNWDFIETMGSRGDDDVCVIFYNEATAQTIHQTDLAMRSEETAQFTLPAIWAGAQIFCWAYLRQGNSRSNSQLVEWEGP